MRNLILGVVAFLGVVLLWYGAWHWLMSDDVARVKASIEYQNQQFKTANNYVVFKAESVEANGFPFHFRVRVNKPTLSMIFNQETYAVSFPYALLELTDSDQGRYRVNVPATFDALYATDGAAPEHYTVTADHVPDMLVRAQANSSLCSGLPGTKQCPPVAADAPITTYAVALPSAITLHMELNGESRDAKFDLMSVNIPLFMDIPKNIDRPLEIFVRVLREALVYKTH